ncbi:Centromere protein F, partial [Apaloderma vittatum]
MLQKQLLEHDELLEKKDLIISKYKKEGADENAITEEINLKMEELQESMEVKTREANENSEKYSSLTVKYYKLEEENETLKTQVHLLSAQLKEPASDAVSTPLLQSDNSLTESSQPVKEMRSDEVSELSSKRQIYEDNRKDNGDPRSPVPETSSQKRRKDDICQILLGQKNTDGEPDGLPHVVGKDIYRLAATPTGKVRPYNLHRTTL